METSLVTNATEVCDWVGNLVSFGNGFADLVFLSAAWEATVKGEDLSAIVGQAYAFQFTLELRVESTAQGAAFLTATRQAWPCSALERIPSDNQIAYPVAVGVTAAGHAIDKVDSMQAYAHAFVANLVSAAVRLIPLGQTEGQQIIAQLESVVDRAVEGALATPIDRVATSTMIVDVVSMNHETQYTRLFRS